MRRLSLLISCLSLFFFTHAQDERTVGLFTYEEDLFEGYTLFNPLNATGTYLIDNCGRLINSWSGPYTPGNSTYLLENGQLLRTAKTELTSNPIFIFGGAGDRVQLLDWESEVLWDFMYSDSTHRMHHDIEPLPNGNVLILAWERFTAEEAIANGRNPDLIPDGELWGEHIIEVVPFTDEIVWEWHFWDHLIQDFDSTKANYGLVAEHPELMDINFVAGSSSNGSKDWMHMNSIDYNAELDQILIHTPYLGEIYIIDHSTTSEEAATHSGGRSNKGGDLLYRWGNPMAYRQGTETDRQFFAAHDAQWIEAGLPDEGKIILFNNGSGRPEGAYSSIDIVAVPEADMTTGNYPYTANTAYAPSDLFWSYTAEEPTDFFSIFLSGAQRLPNGNTLICDGAFGRFFEVNEQGETVWEYVNPVVHTGILAYDEEIPLLFTRNANVVFRCTKYSADYPGFEGKDLTPGSPIELNFPEPLDCPLISDIEPIPTANWRIYPNPSSGILYIEQDWGRSTEIQLYNTFGKRVFSSLMQGNSLTLDLQDFPAGVYFLKIGKEVNQKIILAR